MAKKLTTQQREELRSNMQTLIDSGKDESIVSKYRDNFIAKYGSEDTQIASDIKKKEESQGLSSQKVQTTQAQPIQPKSSGTGSFMGGAEGAYQESKILRLSKKVVEDSKKIELENERIKKEETAKKLGSLNIDFSGGFADIQGIRNQIKTKLKDASISEINAFNDIISENIKKGNVSYTGYRQSSIGKSNELIDNVKNGIELSQEDEAYLRKTSPKAYDELIKSTSDGIIPTSVNSIAKQYKQFNQKRFQASANEDIKGSLNVLSSIGIDVNKIGTYKITEELSKVESKYNTEIEKLNQKYPLKDYTYEINDGRGVSKQTVQKRDDAYAQEKTALDNKYGGLKQTMGKVNAFKFALQNTNADAEAVGEEALRVSDPIRYNNYIKGGKKSIDVKEDVHKLGYTILQSTGNDKLVTKGVAAEQEHENKYPNEVINETKKRIAIEYAKSIGGEKIAFNKGKLSIQDADKFVDQLPQKYKDVYLKKIRPYAVNENGIVSKMTNTSDPNFRYLLTNKEINPKDATIDIPNMGGALNKLGEGFLQPIEGAFNFVLDRTSSNENITNRALQKPKIYQQDLIDRNEINNRIEELNSKRKLSVKDAIELDEKKKQLELSTPFKKVVDGSFSLLGQVLGQVVLSEVGTPVVSSSLKGLQVGSKYIGLANKAEQISNYASEFKNIKGISSSMVAYVSSYSDAEKEAINLGLDGWKKTLYSNTVASLNAATERIFKDEKVLNAFNAEVSPLISDMVRNLSTRGVTDAVLSRELKTILSRTLPKFGKNMTIENQKEAIEELTTQFGTSIAKGVLAPSQFKTQDEIDAMKQVWYETTIFGGFTSFGAAVTETRNSSVSKKAMYQLGSNTDEINKFVDVVNTQVSNGKMSQEDANDKIKAVNTIQQIVQKSIPLIDSKRKLTEGEKVKLSNILLAERKLQDEIKDPNFSDVKLLNEKELSKVQDLKNKILNNEVFIDDNLDVYSEEEYNAKRDAEKLAEEQAKTQTNDTKTETKPETPITEVTTTTGQTAENVGETTTGQAPIIPTAQEQVVTSNTEVKNEPSVSLEEESKVIEAKIAELEAKRKEEYDNAIESFKNKTGKEISQTTKDNLNKKISSTYNPQIEELQSQLKEKQDAIKESNKQQQEGGTESNISQREGAIQGQQESNQVRGGQQGNATQSTTNISNSNQQGEGQKEGGLVSEDIVSNLVDSKVEYNGKIGVIKKDDGGKLTFENENTLIELDGTEKAKEYQPQEVRYNNGDVTIGTDKYKYVSTNQNNNGDVVSVTLVNEKGKNITIRDVDTALAVDRAKSNSENINDVELPEQEETELVKVELQKEFGGAAMQVIESMPDEVADTFIALESGIVALAPNELQLMVATASEWADNAKKEIENSKAPQGEKKDAISMINKFQKDLNKYYNAIEKQKSKSSNATPKQTGTEQSSEGNNKPEEKEKVKQQPTTQSESNINKEFTDEEDRKIKNIAIEANTKVGDYVKSIPTGRKDNFGNNINEFEATNPFTNEKVSFKRQGDASQYVINEIAKANTKKGREDIFKSILSKEKSSTQEQGNNAIINKSEKDGKSNEAQKTNDGKGQEKNVLNEKVQAEGAGAQAASDIPRQKNVFEEFSSVDNAVTLSGLSEKERQAEVDKRNKSLELSDAEKAESKVADLVHKHNGTGQYADYKKLSSLQKQSVKSEIRKISNAQGFEVQDTGGFLRVYKKAKKALKGKGGMAERGLTKVKQLRKDGGRRSILPNNKPLDKRSEEVQKSTIEILNLEVDLDFRNLDDNSRMLPAQLNSAIEDILNGIPSIQATWVLDKIEQSVNSNQFEFGDKVMGFGMIPLDEYLSEARQLANENILANMSDAEIVKMYENQLNQDEQLNNIIKQEYEKQQDVQQPAERITASSIEANKEGAIQQRADEKNKGEEGYKASVNEIPNSNIGLEKGFKEYLQGQNMSKSTKAVMTFVQKMFPKIAANTKIVKDQKVWNKAFEDHNNDPKNADNQLNKDDFNGFYAVGDDGKITILLHPTKSNDETLIHELIHAFTQTILDNPLTVKEKAYVKSINKLFQDAKKSKKVEEFLDGYVFNDVAEFITYTMTNTEFQNLLNSNEATKTSWQKFKEAIGRVFGINSPSMVDKVISETTKIISISDYTNMQDRLSGKSVQETKIQKAENKTVSKINDVIKHLSTIFSGLKNANIKYGLNKGSVIEGLTNDQRTKMFKKAFGETTAKLIRSNMSFGFENPEKLIEFLKNKIPNKSDMPFIIKEMAADLEKEFLSDPENNKKEVTKENPKDLLSQVGYTFFEPLRDLEDAQPFRAYYEGAGSDGREGGSIICTYKDPSRPVRNFVMFIVKDGANETLRASQLTQDNLSQEWKDYLTEKGRLKEDGTFNLENLRAEREDPFSTSVLSIQVPKNGGNPKIISRYNHDLQSSNPDITFNGKLDTLVSGLEDSIYNYVNVSKGVSNKAQLPQNVVEDNQGRLFIYGKEENGFYYGDGFYILAGIATMLDPNTERMVNGIIFKQDGSVLDVAGSDFMLKDIVNNKVKFLPNNSIRLETEYGNIEFPVKNGVAQQNTFIDKSLAIHYFESTQSRFKIDEDEKMIVSSIFDDGVLFYHNDIVEVTGNVRLTSNTPLNADSLEKIGGDIIISNNNTLSAKNLKRVDGGISVRDKGIFISESLQSVGDRGISIEQNASFDAKSLEKVDGNLNARGEAKLRDLKSVKGNLDIFKGDVKLNNLKVVEGAISVSGIGTNLSSKSLELLGASAIVRFGATLTLDSLETIRANVLTREDSTFNAYSLRNIVGDVDMFEESIINAKSIESISGSADFESSITLDSLKSIGQSLYVREGSTFNAKSLKSIGRNAFVSVGSSAMLNSLKSINRDLTIDGKFIANSLQSIGGNLDIKKESNITLDSLQSIDGNVYINGKAKVNSLQTVGGTVMVNFESELEAKLLQNIGASLAIYGYVELDSLKNINGGLIVQSIVTAPLLQSIGKKLEVYSDTATLNALKNVGGDISISQRAKLNAESLENVNGYIGVSGTLLPSGLQKQIKSNVDVKEITYQFNNVYTRAVDKYNVALDNGEDVDLNDFLPDEFKIKKQGVKLSSKTKPVSTTTKKEKTTLKNLINTLQKAIKANVFSDPKILKEKLKEYGVDYTKFMQGVNRLNVDLLDFSDVSKNISKNKIEGKILNEKESKSLQKEIESKYNNSDTPISKRFGQENEDIRQKAFSYDQPLAQKEVNGIDVRIAQGLVEGEPYSGKRRQTYLLYADGKIVGKFYSVNDAKSVVKLIESNLVNRPSISFMQTPNGVIYGAKFPDGTIYVNNENIDLSSPVHEFSHLFEEMYPELWSEGLRLYRDSSGFKKALKEVQDNPAYSNLTEQQQASEALNNLIGEKGVGYFAKGVLLSKFQNWMTKLFKNIGNRIGKQFGIKGLELKPDDKLDFFVNDVLGKLLGGKELKGETKISNITKFSQEYENSPQFEKWKGKNRLVSDRAVQDVKTGEPIVAKVYHGTTNEFYEFDASVKGNIEGHLGKVNYFTTSEDDANQNYLSQGADITARVENLKDRILSTLESEIDESLEEDEREDRIREVVAEFYPNFDNSSLDNDMSLEEIANRISQMELLGGDEKVLDLYVKLNNPIVLGNGSTWFDALEIDETYLEDATKEIADEYGISEEEAKDEYSWEINDRAIEMQGEGNKVVEALEKALSDNGYDSSLASQILGDNYYETEVDLDNIEKSLRKAELYENDNGEMASSQVIADLFKNLGFDGIILTDVSERFKNMGLNNSTSHIHVFDEFSNQIKLADGTNTTFNPDTNDIRYMSINGKQVQVKVLGVDVVNGFYSPLEKIISEVKQDKMPVKQWLEKFAKGDEAKFTGLIDWLNTQQGSVSKSDVQQYLKDNRIDIVEVVKGASNKEYDIVQNDGGYDVIRKDGTIEKKFTDRNEAEKYVSINTYGEISATTKFSQYQLEGEKENYKEVLVTLPSKTVSEFSIKERQNPRGAGVIYDIVSNKTGLKVSTHRDAVEAMDNLKQYNKNIVEDRQMNFKSSHFDEPNILVHLRMNTRKDSEGNKVLFLEEVQSDWGQTGKREGFYDKNLEKRRSELLDKAYEIERKENDNIVTKKVANTGKVTDYEVSYKDEKLKEELSKEKSIINKEIDEVNKKIGIVPTAPFVMDTNDWAKLGLKIALKEAVKQGADKIAWTTGEQQNERYDLSKQVKQVEWNRYTERGAVKLVTITPITGNVIELPIDENGFVSKNAGTQFDGQRIDNVIGKEIGDKIVSENSGDLSGDGLKVGGKGMKGFYGSPTEGSLGIVGNVAKSLFKQEVKTVNIETKEVPVEYAINVFIQWAEGKGISANKAIDIWDNNGDLKKEFKNVVDSQSKEISTQHSIDITPELKAQVSEGLPMFMVRQNETQATKSEIENAINSLDTAVSEYESDDSIDNYLGLNDAFETLAYTSINDAQNMAKELSSKYPELKDDFNSILNEASKPKAESKKITNESDAIRTLISEDVDGRLYPTIVDSLGKFAQQVTAETTSNVQGREVNGDYVRLTLQNMKDIATQKMLQLQDVLGEDWVKKSIDFFEREPYSGNPAIIIGLSNIISTDLDNKIREATDIKEIDSLTALQNRMDRVVNRNGRVASLALNYRRIFTSFAKGDSVTDAMSGNNLSEESKKQIEAVKKALAERPTDEELNSVGEVVTPSEPIAKSNKSSRKTTSDNTLKAQIKNNAINSLTQIDENGKKITRTWQDAVREAKEEAKNHKC